MKIVMIYERTKAEYHCAIDVVCHIFPETHKTNANNSKENGNTFYHLYYNTGLIDI